MNNCEAMRRSTRMTAEMEKRKRMAVFSGSSNLKLADEIAQELGISLGNVKLEKFANGEIYARYQESVRGAAHHDRRR